MNMKRGTLLKCAKCGEINEVIVELKITERYPYPEEPSALEKPKADPALKMKVYEGRDLRAPKTRAIKEIDFNIKREAGKRDQHLELGTPASMMLALNHQNNIDALLEEKKAKEDEE